MPGDLCEALGEYATAYNANAAANPMTVDHVENKCLKITLPSGQEDVVDTVVKVTFRKDANDQLLCHFYRKSGDILNWAAEFKKMQETQLDFLGTSNVPLQVAEVAE